MKIDKAESSTLLTNMVSLKYKDKWNIRENIMEMSYIASKLKPLNLELPNDLLMHLVLISLPFIYSVNLRSIVIVKIRSGLLMSSFNTVCKKKKCWSEIEQKMLTWIVPLRTSSKKERIGKIHPVQLKRNTKAWK